MRKLETNSFMFPFKIPINIKKFIKYFADGVCSTGIGIFSRDIFELEESTYNKPIPAHIYRVVVHPVVTLSPNDRAYQVPTTS